MLVSNKVAIAAIASVVLSSCVSNTEAHWGGGWGHRGWGGGWGHRHWGGGWGHRGWGRGYGWRRPWWGRPWSVDAENDGAVEAVENKPDGREVTVTLGGANAVVSRAHVNNDFIIDGHKESALEELKLAGLDKVIEAGEFSDLFIVTTGDTDFVVLTRGNINIATEPKPEAEAEEEDKE